MSEPVKNLKLFDTKQTEVIRLYHGSSSEVVTPTYGLGDDIHDYGRGFYLTPDIELAKEWAVSSSHGRDGWVHGYSLDLSSVSVFDFETAGKMKHLIWATEIAKHRALNGDAQFMSFYDIYRDFLNDKFGVDTSAYDVLRGWRADDAYISIINSFLANALSVPALQDAILLGDLGIQYCCKSERAFEQLTPLKNDPEYKVPVPYLEYSKRYSMRIQRGREQFRALMQSPLNRNKNSVRLSDLWRAAK